MCVCVTERSLSSVFLKANLEIGFELSCNLANWCLIYTWPFFVFWFLRASRLAQRTLRGSCTTPEIKYLHINMCHIACIIAFDLYQICHYWFVSCFDESCLTGVFALCMSESVVVVASSTWPHWESAESCDHGDWTTGKRFLPITGSNSFWCSVLPGFGPLFCKHYALVCLYSGDVIEAWCRQLSQVQ